MEREQNGIGKDRMDCSKRKMARKESRLKKKLP